MHDTLVECTGAVQNCMCNTGFVKWVLFLDQVVSCKRHRPADAASDSLKRVCYSCLKFCCTMKGTDMHMQQ